MNEPQRQDAGASPLYRNRDFLLIVAASAISTLGSKMSRIALPILVYALTHSAFWTAIVAAAEQLPYVAFSLLAGAWVDRANRKVILVTCDIARALLFATIPLAWAFGTLHVWHLAIALFAAGTCTVLFQIAEVAVLPQVAAAGQLRAARSTAESVEAASGIAGPAVGGAVIALRAAAAAGSVLAFLVDSVSYAASAVTLSFVRKPLDAPPVAQKTSIGAAIREGLRFLWHVAPLRALLIVTAVVNGVQAPYWVLVVTAAREVGASPLMLGGAFGVAGVAGLLGSLCADAINRALTFRQLAVLALAFWTVSALVLASATTTLAVTAGLALTQFVWPPYAVAVVTYRLRVTPPALHGRVTSAFRTISYGVEPVGLALAGIAARQIGAAATFYAAAAALALAFLFAVRSAALKAAEAPAA